jgi:hypothetical protein
MGVKVTDQGDRIADPRIVANPSQGNAEAGMQLLNRELQDKGFLVTSTEDIINWARTGSCTG